MVNLSRSCHDLAMVLPSVQIYTMQRYVGIRFRVVCVRDNCDGVHHGEIQGDQRPSGISARMWPQEEHQNCDVTVARPRSLLYRSGLFHSRL